MQPRWHARLLLLPSNPRWILHNPEGGLSYPVEEGAGKGVLALGLTSSGHQTRFTRALMQSKMIVNV